MSWCLISLELEVKLNNVEFQLVLYLIDYYITSSHGQSSAIRNEPLIIVRDGQRCSFLSLSLCFLKGNSLFVFFFFFFSQRYVSCHFVMSRSSIAFFLFMVSWLLPFFFNNSGHSLLPGPLTMISGSSLI